MLRLSKKVDYGLIALKHMINHGNGHLTNAKEISIEHNLPADLLAKILQRLAKHGIVTSKLGSGGGYRLNKDPSEVSLNDVIQSIEGPLHLLACNDGHKRCANIRSCTVRKNLKILERGVLDLISSTTLCDLLVAPQ